jgi:hypothetical protein
MGKMKNGILDAFSGTIGSSLIGTRWLAEQTAASFHEKCM